MAEIATPQVEVFQEFTTTADEAANPLRACVVGPNADLHRYDEADEKALIDVGEYGRLEETCYPWPAKTAGSTVDEDSVRLFIDGALLLYHEDLLDNATEGRGTVSPVAGYNNRIRSSALSYKSNGSDNPRSAVFLDRDVKVGDRAYVRGVTDDVDCDEIELWTYVEGFSAEVADGTILPATSGTTNKMTTESAATIEQTDGPINCIGVAADASGYDGLADGYPCETYTIEVVRSSVAGCNAARLRITSASGTDNQSEVQAEELGTPTLIGTRGLEVTFDNSPGDCSLSASSEGVATDELVVGQKWQVVVCQDFEKACAEEGGEYTGDFDDTYIITVTKGGHWDELPQITVTTAKGLDSSGPTTITGPDVEFPIGTNGVTIKFVDCYGSDSSEASAQDEPFSGNSNLAALCKGDKFYITVVSGANGPIQTLILRHDLPDEISAAADLDLRLFIVKDIEVTENRISDPPAVNYEFEETQLCVQAGITAYDSSWTDGGVEQPMPVYGGDLFIEYREWLATLCGELNSIRTAADLDDIPGPLAEDNPLKWGVYHALLGSNGTAVFYIAVCEPDDIDSWQDTLERLNGRDDLYNYVPLTYDRAILLLFQGQADAESTPEVGNWKAMFVNLQAVSEKRVVGQSSADVQLLTPTSTDGDVVLAVLEDNPQASGTQYTRLRVAAGNAGFTTYGVRAGDVVRFLFTIDAFGETSYSEFLVDHVLSENTLLLLTGHDESISVAQKIEIWRTLTKTEIKDDLKQQAQAWANRRVVATWPDLVGNGGNTMPGYFLNCVLAGMVSSVSPHQPLTNVAIPGFDDLASRTINYFSRTQLDDLDDAGVWICTEDRDGTPYTRNALTTDVTSLKTRSESIRRNVDSMSFLFHDRLKPFIGRTNATPTMLRKLEYETRQIIKFLKTNGFTEELGSQLIDGTIREGFPRIHPLMADRAEIVLDLVVPAPLNNIDCHLVI